MKTENYRIEKKVQSKSPTPDVKQANPCPTPTYVVPDKVDTKNLFKN